MLGWFSKSPHSPNKSGASPALMLRASGFMPEMLSSCLMMNLEGPRVQISCLRAICWGSLVSAVISSYIREGYECVHVVVAILMELGLYRLSVQRVNVLPGNMPRSCDTRDLSAGYALSSGVIGLHQACMKPCIARCKCVCEPLKPI